MILAAISAEGCQCQTMISELLGAQTFLQIQKDRQRVNKYSHLFNPEVSLLCSQTLAIGLYTGPLESNPLSTFRGETSEYADGRMDGQTEYSVNSWVEKTYSITLRRQ
jgi:hypothetical protein